MVLNKQQKHINRAPRPGIRFSFSVPPCEPRRAIIKRLPRWPDPHPHPKTAWNTPDETAISLFHDLLEEVVQRSVAVRHHDGPLVGEGVVQVADHLNRHVRFT